VPEKMLIISMYQVSAIFRNLLLSQSFDISKAPISADENETMLITVKTVTKNLPY